MISTLGRVLKWIILLPVLAAVVLLAVANDQTVPVHFNPFDTSDPVLRADLPLYQIAFIVFVIGALVGALVTWTGQHRYRRRARQEHREAEFWHDRADRAERQKAEAQPSAVTAYLPRPERG